MVRDRRCALLTAALGILQLRQEPPGVVPLRDWLDSWRGLGDIVRGLNAQGFDLELRQFPRGWRANIYPTGSAHSIVVASAWEPTPWRAVQRARRVALSRPKPAFSRAGAGALGGGALLDLLDDLEHLEGHREVVAVAPVGFSTANTLTSFSVASATSVMSSSP
jgi:hypothetical protein